MRKERDVAAPRTARVLLIEGDAFTGSLVSKFGCCLGATGKYEISCLGWRVSEGLTGEHRKEQVFCNFHYFPEQVIRPEGPLGAVRLGLEYLAAPRPPKPLSVEPTGLKSRVYRAILWSRKRSRLAPVLERYDLYHWHCFLPEQLPVLEYARPSAPLLVSLWGSDLFRTAGVAEFSRQLAACRRASMFTVASLEMRETFLSKFGREFATKVRLVTYGTDMLNFDEVRGQREQFLESIGIPPGFRTITIGNSGSAGNQHVRVLREISRLPANLVRGVALLIPMTYAVREGYIDQVRAAAAECGLPFVIFESQMSDRDVARLRAASDVMIHVPISDQFSGAMCESLVAGCVLVTGAWLPYSLLRLNRIFYHEVADVDLLSTTLSSVLLNLQEEKARTLQSSAVLKGLISWNSVQPRWAGLYDELLAPSAGS